MAYAAFKQRLELTWESICREMLETNRDHIRIKKEKTALENLGKIFSATLEISNQTGFQAMTMRDLAQKTGISIGAMYAYFSSKEELLSMMQRQHGLAVMRILDERLQGGVDPPDKLERLIRAHIYLSEALQPWFYFSFMEAKNLSDKHREMAVSGALYTEKMIENILREGQAAAVFKPAEPVMVAGMVKALLQDWYLNRAKHARRHITVEQYVSFLLDFVMSYLAAPAHAALNPLSPPR